MPSAFFFIFYKAYKACGQTTAGQISLGHLGLPSSGQHLFEQLEAIGPTDPAPVTFFSSVLESFFKFFIRQIFCD